MEKQRQASPHFGIVMEVVKVKMSYYQIVCKKQWDRYLNLPRTSFGTDLS